MSRTTPDPAPPASGAVVSGQSRGEPATGVTAKKVAQVAVPLAILGLLIASDLLLCPIKLFFGFPCPGCGMTRATFALMHGHVLEALRLHPLVWLITPLVSWTLLRVTLVSAGVLSPRSFDPMDRLPKWFWWASMALLLGVWVIRLAGGLGGPPDPIDPAGGLIARAFSLFG